MRVIGPSSPLACAAALLVAGCTGTTSPTVRADLPGSDPTPIAVPSIQRPQEESAAWWFRAGAAAAHARGAGRATA